MIEFWIGVASAFWFGILTSISPCPLATNIAAVSYIGRKAAHTRLLFLSGILYAIGRMFAYMVVGILTVKGLYAISSMSFFLQKYMNLFVGPFLIVIGMMVLDIISFKFLKSGGNSFLESLQNKFKDGGVTGSFFLGAIFALAFCPVSAALFFGSLIPISLKINSLFIAPLVYGFGTAIPVMVFAILIGIGSKSISTVFNKITIFEKWVRITTGIVIIIIGIYLTITNVFNL
ncbi:MAG: sulfite exporter TauE/SafE family protein [Oligoflexia bacterium]|nr:sulfite exporter TauE/SafE family protein [Oligoflexia bacterium]